MLISLISIAMIVGKLLFGGRAALVDHLKLYWVAASVMACALITMQGNPSYGLLLGSCLLIGLATVGAFGPLLAGWLYDLTGSYDIAFNLFLLILIPAAIGMSWLKPPLPGTPSSIE